MLRPMPLDSCQKGRAQIDMPCIKKEAADIPCASLRCSMHPAAAHLPKQAPISMFCGKRRLVSRATKHAAKRHKSSSQFAGLPLREGPVVLKTEPCAAGPGFRQTSETLFDVWLKLRKWVRSVRNPSRCTSGKPGHLHSIKVESVAFRPPRVRCRASLLGSSHVPGWSTRIALLMGGGLSAARPLACTCRAMASHLLRDAQQVSAEMGSTARELARVDSWGQQEDADLDHARCSAGILAVLSPLEPTLLPACAAAGTSCTRTSRSGLRCRRMMLMEVRAGVDNARIHRVGLLLAKMREGIISELEPGRARQD